MSLIQCTLKDLKNESDVEQKLLWPLLTSDETNGLGFRSPDIWTKPDLREFTIDKGSGKKVYRPDYVVVLAGFPLLAVEAKHPKDDDLEEALREARLYAAELNALYPTGVNPCTRVVASNGLRLITSPSDSSTIDRDVAFAQLNHSSEEWSQLATVLRRATFQSQADELRRRNRRTHLSRAINLLGGQTIRNEEIGYNQFGAKLATEFLHLFNPRTRQERLHIVRNAYVKSRRREHYTDEIDRVLRASLPATVTDGVHIDDTNQPQELISALRRGMQLQDKLFLLVGSVGSGKSTFITYFRETKFTQELEDSTIWIHVDMNEAPPSTAGLEQWVVREIVRKLKVSAGSDVDLDEYEQLTKVFSVELNRLKKGPLAPLDPDSDKYRETISDELRKLLSDEEHHARALARYLAGERNKLLVLVLDNGDKGNKEEQLAVFQTVRWLQSWLRCLAFLPLRDITYSTCRMQPPLDTVIKDFVFQIETPPFTRILRRRLKLALDELTSVSTAKRCEYKLEGGITVVYPETEVGVYLASIFRSIYEYDRMLRRMIVGLAGKDIRLAMEIFLDFCRSGHIDEKEYLKIRTAKGQHSLPFHVINRVLLRQNRRFYDGDKSYVRNLFQVDRDEAWPDHLPRFSILVWLHAHFRKPGPSGIRGFHRCDTIITDLVPLGHDASRLRSELQYLLKAGCLIAEHQRTDSVADDDLVCLSSAGFVHLELSKNRDYLAACAEDTWVMDNDLAKHVAERIGQRGSRHHYSFEVSTINAVDFMNYLANRIENDRTLAPAYLSKVADASISEVLDIRRRVVERASSSDWIGKYVVGETYDGLVAGVANYGIFVTLQPGVKGLIHVSQLPDSRTVDSFSVGDKVTVRIYSIDAIRRRMSFDYAE